MTAAVARAWATALLSIFVFASSAAGVCVQEGGVVPVEGSTERQTEANEAVAAQAAEAELVEEFEEMDEDLEDGNLMAIMGVQPGNMVGAKRFHLTQIFAVELEEMQRVCELDKKQFLKLKVAAKGAVKKSLDQWKKTSGNMFGRPMAVAADGEILDGDGEGADAPEVEEVEITDADEIDEMTLQMISMNQMGNPFNMEDERDSRFWKKTVAAVLSDEQMDKLANHRDAKRIARRKAVIASTVAGLEVELGLSEEQTAKLTALVTPKMQEAKVKCMAMYEPYVLNYYASKVDESELKKVFSNAQLQKWKIYMGPSKQIGQMIEMEAGEWGVEEVEIGGNVFDSIGETAETIVNALDGLMNMFDK